MALGLIGLLDPGVHLVLRKAPGAVAGFCFGFGLCVLLCFVALWVVVEWSFSSFFLGLSGFSKRLLGLLFSAVSDTSPALSDPVYRASNFFRA